MSLALPSPIVETCANVIHFYLQIKHAISWIKEHQEPEGDWAGIYPPMHLSTLALLLEDSGLSKSSMIVSTAIAAMDRFCAEDEEHGRWMQASVSPTWDTFLMIRALLDGGVIDSKHEVIERATQWSRSQQILAPKSSDWKVARPNTLGIGSFAFEYFNVNRCFHNLLTAIICSDSISSGWIPRCG